MLPKMACKELIPVHTSFYSKVNEKASQRRARASLFHFRAPQERDCRADICRASQVQEGKLPAPHPKVGGIIGQQAQGCD